MSFALNKFNSILLLESSQLKQRIMSEKFTQIISPLINNGISLREQKLALHKMFALAVANAPENETDNFTAKQLMPVYLALCEIIENIQDLD
jgi:hypothetical protein